MLTKPLQIKNKNSKHQEYEIYIKNTFFTHIYQKNTISLRLKHSCSINYNKHVPKLYTHNLAS